MSPEIKKASAWLASLATYTGFVVGVWALPWSTSVKIVVLAFAVLFAAMVVLIAAVAKTRREMVALQERNAELQAKAAEAEDALELENGMVALAYMLTEDPTADTDNHYTEVVESYRIDGSDATYQYQLRGRRVADGNAAWLEFKVSGDAPADASSLLAEAVDVATGQPLSIAFVRDESYFKVIQVIFKEPISSGDSFDIDVTLRWGGTFPLGRRRDYLFAHWGQYARRGIDRHTCKLSSDVEVRNVTLEELKDGRRARSKTQPKIVSAHGRCEVTWSSSAPSVLYLLQFEKVYN
jgi:hypothetical protein